MCTVALGRAGVVATLAVAVVSVTMGCSRPAGTSEDVRTIEHLRQAGGYAEVARLTASLAAEFYAHEAAHGFERGAEALQRCADTLMRHTRGEENPETISAALNHCVYTVLGVTFTGERNDPSADHPWLAVASGKGSCLGIGLMQLILAEQAGIPLYGVFVPGHFFVRYDNGTTRRTLETLRDGSHRDDAWYRRVFPHSERAWYLSRNLTVAQVAAVILFNIGNAYAAQGEHARAVRILEGAVELMPDWAHAWGNLAVSLEQCGRYREALASLEQAAERDDDLENLQRNRAALHLRLGNIARALEHYRAAVERTPHDTLALYGLGYVHLLQGEYVSALHYGSASLSLAPSFSEAQELVVRAREGGGYRGQGGER